MGLQVSAARVASVHESEDAQRQDHGLRKEQDTQEQGTESSPAKGKQRNTSDLPEGYQFRSSSIDSALAYHSQFSDLQMPQGLRPTALNVQRAEHDAKSISGQIGEVEQRKRESVEAAEAAQRLVAQASRSIASEVSSLSAAVSSAASAAPTGKVLSSVVSSAPLTNQREETVSLATSQFSAAMSEIYRAKGTLLGLESSILSKDAALSGNYGIVVDLPSFEARRTLSEVASLVAGQRASLGLQERTLHDQFEATLLLAA